MYINNKCRIEYLKNWSIKVSTVHTNWQLLFRVSGKDPHVKQRLYHWSTAPAKCTLLFSVLLWSLILYIFRALRALSGKPDSCSQKKGEDWLCIPFAGTCMDHCWNVLASSHEITGPQYHIFLTYTRICFGIVTGKKNNLFFFFSNLKDESTCLYKNVWHYKKERRLCKSTFFPFTELCHFKIIFLWLKN